MLNITDKADNTAGATGELTAAEYNNHKNELQLSVTRAGLSLNELITNQLAQAMFINGVAAQTVVDSGTANSVILSPLTGSSGLAVSSTYLGLDGAVLEFEKSAPNTTTSVTVNFGPSGSELGAKNLVRPDGSVCQPGDVDGRCRVQWDNANDEWVLLINGSGYFNEYLSAGTTFTPKAGMNHRIHCDTSAGGFTVALNTHIFDGQKVQFVTPDDAVGILYVTGVGAVVNNIQDGIYVGGSSLGTPVFKDDQVSRLDLEGSEKLGQWIPVYALTADYVSGDYRIQQLSIGNMEQEAFVDQPVTSAVNNFFGTSSGTVYYGDSSRLYPVPFAATPRIFSGQQDSIATHYYSNTATGVTIRVFGATVSSFIKAFYVSRGRY